MSREFDYVRLAERIVYYGICLVGIACGYALFTRQLGTHSYQYSALGAFAALGVVSGAWKAYDDITRAH